MSKTRVTVSAAANIALIKYWGKLEKDGNQPATASLSIGLEDLRTTTRLAFAEGNDHSIRFNDDVAAEARIRAYLEQLLSLYEVDRYLAVESSNNFPTGTGLASSASGFAALAMGVSELLQLNLSRTVLSQHARSGSGSAARSVYGGYVEVIPADEAYASRIMPASAWPLAVIVAVTQDGAKATGSTEAMRRTAATSPYYDAWLTTHMDDMHEAKLAITDRDFGKLAEISEHNCLKMHGTIITSRPSVLYWLPATLAVMHEVTRLRQSGTPAFFTIDAGSQVKIICEPDDAREINRHISEIPGVLRTIQTHVGGEPVITSE